MPSSRDSHCEGAVRCAYTTMSRAALAMPAPDQTPVRADSDDRQLFPNSGLCGCQGGLGPWCRSTPLTHSTHPPTHSFPPPLPARGRDSFFLLNCIKNDAGQSCLSPHTFSPLPARIRALRSTPRVPMKTTPDRQRSYGDGPPWPASAPCCLGPTWGPSARWASLGDKRRRRFLMRAGPSLQSSSHREQGVAPAAGPHKPSSPKSCSWIRAQALAALTLPHLRLCRTEQ